jgi:hypothetical protein
MSSQLFYQCVVLDNQDPLMLGRVRAKLLSDNYDDIVKSFVNPPFNEEKDAWTERDPFIFNPLLPFFYYQVPQIEELINVLYYNNDFKYRNQFYVQAMFSSPYRAPFEYFVGSQKFTGIGVQYTDPIPPKNQDGTYPNSAYKGVFPEPGDNAILGRGNADVVVKEDSVLIRANKIKGQFNPNIPPSANNKGGFLQITKFDSKKNNLGTKQFTQIKEEIVSVNYLIEYNIINPSNVQDRFTGNIYLYKLKPDLRTNSQNLNLDSSIDDLKSLIIVQDFQALSLQETINFINNWINLINSQNNINGRNIFTQDNKFPIFYRPSPSNYTIISSLPTVENSQERSVLNEIFNKVQLNNTAPKKGYGLIYTKDKVGTPFKITKTKGDVFGYSQTPITYGTLASDRVILLSQQSNKFGKEPINMSDTLYGISESKFVEEILPKTSSLVRGEELMELLNLIVRYLVTHTHSFPGLPPVPVGYDGVRVEQILTEIQNAANKILNENIRLN